MSGVNPYARFLDGRPVETILAETAPAMTAHLKTMGPEKAAAAPAPGKWSPAEILCHLADCELAFGFRLRQTLAEDGPTVQSFDQEKWAATYSGIPADRALAAFSTFRAWNLQLMTAALPAAAGRQMTHPEWGTVTFMGVLEMIAGHDLNHLAQFERIAKK